MAILIFRALTSKWKAQFCALLNAGYVGRACYKLQAVSCI